MIENLTNDGQVFHEIGTFYGNPERTVGQYLDEAKTGKPLEFFVTTCPDYPSVVGETGIRFTFDNVGDGPGLVANGLVRSILPLVQRLENGGFLNVVNFVYADIEALDRDVVSAVNISPEEFMRRVGLSLESLSLLLGAEYSYGKMVQFSSPKVSLMSSALGPDGEVLVNSILQTVKEGRVEGVRTSKRGLYQSMYERLREQKVLESLGYGPGIISYNEFTRNRAIKDIRDHIRFGEAVRTLSEEEDRNIIIVTMSKPNLSVFFNYSQRNPRSPVLMIDSNYRND